MLCTKVKAFAILAIVAGFGLVNQSPARADDDDKGFVKLFDGKSLDGWKVNVFGKDDGKVFTVKDGAIVVSGKPNGYFYTEKSYKNYVLRFDWKFSKDGNSGLLMHIQGHGKSWPRSLEIQGEQRTHASIIPIGIKVKGKTDKDAQKKAIKFGEWNTTEVAINDGEFSAKINGQLISTGKILSEDVKEGPIGFQSEGTELHFKNIKIKVLEGDKGAGALKLNINGAIGVGTLELQIQGGGRIVAVLAGNDDKGWTKLFNGKNLDGLKFFLDPKAKDADPENTFVVKDGVLQVSGFPNGYFYTAKSYKNYVLRYDWTYPKEQPEKTTMNSGCLVHIQEPHKVWPHSVEPQCRYMDHGKLFFIGFPKGAKVEQNFDEAAQKKALKPHYEWNSTETTCRSDGSITVKINGVLVNSGKSELTEGPIGFQSEGAIIHFKNIKIKMLE